MTDDIENEKLLTTESARLEHDTTDNAIRVLVHRGGRSVVIATIPADPLAE